MKRVGNIFEQIISLDNLRLADTKARRGKLRSYGVLHHDKNREANIQRLHEMLKNKTYRTSDYEVFTIRDPKERSIYRLPYFPDRIVHHAIMNILEPIWVSVFTKNTYACIKDRGIHAAMKGVKQSLADTANTQYCLKIDVRKYYPSIDHEILKSILRRKIKCKDTLELLDHIIDSAPGVPIGNYLSQYFANLYLSYFDHWIKEVFRVKYYFRYADDMVFFHADKSYLQDLLTKIKEYLQKELNLQLKANFQVFPVDKRGVDFIGYVFRHTHILMRKGIKKNLCRAVAKLNKKQVSESEYKQVLCSWMGWAKHCNAKNLINKITKNKYYESNVRLAA